MMKTFVTATTLAAGLACAAGTLAQPVVSNEYNSRQRPVPVELDSMRYLTVSTMGEIIRDEVRTTDISRGGPGSVCTDTETYSQANFAGGQFVLQAGFVEGEIAATSFTLPADRFPLELQSAEMIFATQSAGAQTVTEWSFLVWEGTPDTGTLIATFSSDDVILPHIVLGPGTAGVNVMVAVDPDDPEQIAITDNGTQTFTVGYRIDSHNQQIGNGCIIPPPQNNNAFPSTDPFDGGNPTDLNNNWLFAIDCGLGGLGCGPGWVRFADLPNGGLVDCRPSGDWNIKATWQKINCIPGFGACCLPNGTCNEMDSTLCVQQGGEYQGDGVDCTMVNCPLPTGACCFTNESCVILEEATCLTLPNAQWQGPGSICDGDFDGLPDGTCFFIPECPADVNGDGMATPADFTAWLGCFNDPNSAPYCDNADVNNSGSIEPADFTSWLASFNAGCP